MEASRLRPSDWPDRARALAAEGWLLMDLCGLDRLNVGGDDRFEVVVQLLHRERRERMTVHVAARGEPPTVPSVTAVWPTADFMEREAFDMFGLVFDGHPNLTRILMPDEWEGHPLRKDYGVGKFAIRFIPQPYLQIDAPGQSTHGTQARAEVDGLGQSGRARRDLGSAPGAGGPRGIDE